MAGKPKAKSDPKKKVQSKAGPGLDPVGKKSVQSKAGPTLKPGGQ